MKHLVTVLLMLLLPLIAQEERIISLSPALTELVFKLGKGRQLIARSEPCDYPPEVKNLPVAGRFADPDMERILTLRPTLVITNDLINPGVRTVMENAKIRCIQKQCSTIEEYVEWVELLGDALKCPMRFAFLHHGKSGSARVIYVDFEVSRRLYFVNVFAKSEKENLTAEERNELKAVVETLELEN